MRSRLETGSAAEVVLPRDIVRPPLAMPRSQSLAEQAAEAIVDGIASGALAPSQRLIEAELAAMLQISRVPLREALKILEAQGITASVLHRGSFIATFDDRHVAQICEARIALERIALRGAVETYRRSPERLDQLEALIGVIENAAARLAWMEISRADLAFHREICHASENNIVMTLWESLARHVLIIFGQEIQHVDDAAALGEHHRVLYNMLAAGDTRSLTVEIETHILRRPAGLVRPS